MKKMIILPVLCSLVFVPSFVSSDEAVPQMRVGQDGMDSQFEGFNLEGYSDNGNKAWDVEGDSADIQGAEIHLTNVNANSYGDSEMNVMAKTGKIDQVSGNMELHEDVVITHEDGSQLTTDSLSWSRNDDLVTTEDAVMINNEQMVVTGKGLQAKPSQSRTTIHENVRVVVEPEPEKKDRFVTITSDGPMTIDQTNFMARFEDNVVAVQKDQTLKADAIEIFFNEDMANITRMVCLGNVEVTQGDNKTYAQQAVYNATTKHLVLSGRPKLIIATEGDDVLTAFGD